MTQSRLKTVIVTGASSGIGAATARAFSGAGYRVMAAGRNAQRLHAAVAELENVRTWSGDLCDAQACADLVSETIGAFGGVDVLVNNAGVIHRARAEDTTDHQWRETMAVNLDAVFYLSRAVVPALRNQGGGAIVNIASDWGLQGGERAAAYCASKGAVVLFSKAMALDHAAENIRINAICPGDVNTPMLAAEAHQRGLDVTETIAACAADSPNGRLTEPEEVADLAVFLASDQARAINGVALPIDGGASA
ncbi:SDR family oxidoreductase [Magnetovibrio sp.]|uniref:SDR family NAD(P)-dependent oxidoreductase n=1 Tax=Magnetovibrio sp. TaxID=2024836 RepID=UPI002F92A0AF